MVPVFTWNVDREIVSFTDSIALRWYSLLFAGGIILGYFITGKWFQAEGKRLELVDSLLMYVVIGTVVGARLGHCLFYDPAHYLSRPWEILMVWEGGLASHGGYTGVIIGLILFCRKYPEISFFWLADRIAITSMLGGAFIRIGNFFNSEIIGRPADVPWAVIFQKVDQVPRHPTQIYEALGYATISLIGYLYYRAKNRRVYEGRIVGIIMTLAFSYRFFIEFFKENQEAFENAMIINMGQILSLPFILFGIFLITGKHHDIPLFQKGISDDHYGGGRTVTEPEEEARPARASGKGRQKRKKRR